ncbi:32803_t:CDS:2 [Racocetra persica]|uniref:32803_t:CDS:1 n=1 Tax=Racocetra persica TaxID=160502 RepID=A0ACA9SMN6_9GLOM|nr:32803_t:CDS:2 [Racocetra persica]
MEEHWRTNCTGNRHCDICFKKYMELKQKPENLINRVKHIQETAKKIRAVKIIQQKWIEIIYKPDGLKTKELAEHYKLL